MTAAPRTSTLSPHERNETGWLAHRGGHRRHDTPVYDRYRLTPGTRLGSPAIIEERESTTVIGPGARVVVDARLTIIAEPAG